MKTEMGDKSRANFYILYSINFIFVFVVPWCFKDVWEIFGGVFQKMNTMSFFFQIKYEMLNFQICQRQCPFEM